jgi:hypothetical protein
VHSCCELENETLFGVICGEFLAIGIAGTLERVASLLELIKLYFLICICFQIN